MASYGICKCINFFKRAFLAQTNSTSLTKKVEKGSGETNLVHLADEALVAEEVGAPETAVRVSEVLANLYSHIWKLTDNQLGGVVLLLGVVKMLSILLDVKVTNYMLEELEGVIILMFNT